MRGTNDNSGSSDLDAKMAQIVDALDKFQQALQQATEAVKNNAPSSTVSAALGAAQNASFGVSSASGGANGFATTSAVWSGISVASLLQGSSDTPFGGGQSSLPPRDAMGRFISAGMPAHTQQSSGFDGDFTPVGPFSSLANAPFMANAYAVRQNPLNPFAGAAAMGPASSIGAAGFNLNSYLYQQQATRAQQMQQLGFVGIGVGVSAISGGLSAWAGNTAGDYDPMAGAAALGRTSGAVLGLVGGAAFGMLGKEPAPGLGALIGSGLGAEMGGALSAAFMAPFMRTRRAVSTLTGIAARQGVDPYELFGAGETAINVTNRTAQQIHGRTPGGLDDMAQSLTFGGKSAHSIAQIKAGVYTGTDIISGPQVAETYATFGSALLAAGEDSRGAYDLTKRTASKYYMNAPHMAQMAAPVIAAQNQYGQNSADLLMRYGPEAYGAAADALGQPDLTSTQLKAYGGVQTSRYRAQKASLQTRGVGAALESAFDAEMSDLAALPDGKDSLEYAQARSHRRSARLEKYRTQDVTDYELPMTHLRGERDRAEVLPYSPTNLFKLDLQMIGQNKAQIGKLKGRLNSLRSSGDLSEDEELRLHGQMESLRTENARAVAGLSEGMENRLPALAAGRPRQSMAFNSMQLAALNLQMMNSPVRGSGAVNGRQLKVQDDFVAMLGGDETEIGPKSRTQQMNSSASRGLESTLSRLASALEKMTGGAANANTSRTGEMAGQAMGQLAQKDVGQSTYHQNRN